MQKYLEKKAIAQETYNEVVKWKKAKGIDLSDESEYRYLMRDLEIIKKRPIDPQTDLLLPLGGDGPPLHSFITNIRSVKMYYLSKLGEYLYRLLSQNDRPSYENVLFWAILRNDVYIPLFQEILSDPASYREKKVEPLIHTSDSTSVNCVLAWGRFFKIFSKCKEGHKLVVDVSARRILSASILELNTLLSERTNTKRNFYIAELVDHLSTAFNLTKSAIDFQIVLDLVFNYSPKTVLSGYTSGRNDLSLIRKPNVQILRFHSSLTLKISAKPGRNELLKILRYVAHNR